MVADETQNRIQIYPKDLKNFGPMLPAETSMLPTPQQNHFAEALFFARSTTGARGSPGAGTTATILVLRNISVIADWFAVCFVHYIFI